MVATSSHVLQGYTLEVSDHVARGIAWCMLLDILNRHSMRMRKRRSCVQLYLCLLLRTKSPAVGRRMKKEFHCYTCFRLIVRFGQVALQVCLIWYLPLFLLARIDMVGWSPGVVPLRSGLIISLHIQRGTSPLN